MKTLRIYVDHYNFFMNTSVYEKNFYIKINYALCAYIKLCYHTSAFHRIRITLKNTHI